MARLVWAATSVRSPDPEVAFAFAIAIPSDPALTSSADALRAMISRSLDGRWAIVQGEARPSTTV
jgi:hypothetical protein